MANARPFADTVVMQDFEPRDELELGPTYPVLAFAFATLAISVVVAVLVIAATTMGL